MSKFPWRGWAGVSDRGDHFVTMVENLNAMAGSLARMEDLRRQFVADVSHEFQSPLTSILGFAEASEVAPPRRAEVAVPGDH